MTIDEARREATDTVRHLLFGKYTAGGDNPSDGWDCRGVCVEAVKSVGIIEHATEVGKMVNDLRELVDYPVAHVTGPAEGVLIFLLDAQGRAQHVEYCINVDLSIGARGPGDGIAIEKATSLFDWAYKRGAYVKKRPIPIGWPNRIEMYIDPFKLPWCSWDIE